MALSKTNKSEVHESHFGKEYLEKRLSTKDRELVKAAVIPSKVDIKDADTKQLAA